VVLIETEAYGGQDDPGSHAFRGQTGRNQAMFGPSGHLYMYFIYGNHWMANIVARPAGEPAAILLRSAVPKALFDHQDRQSAAHSWIGPGRLCRTLGLGQSDYGRDLFSDSEMRLGLGDAPAQVLTGPRVGLAQGKGDTIPWRFIDAEWARFVAKSPLAPP
jgi:DNA-3-methyladenine glycosylase